MKSHIWTLGAVLLSASTSINALEVSAGSDCYDICTEPTSGSDSSSGSSTNASQIVCEDQQYSSTTTGIKFKNCLQCLQGSNSTSASESDTYWFLYNLRYAFDVCLYSYPAATKVQFIDSPCNVQDNCGPLEDAFKTSLLVPDSENTFDYCGANNSQIDIGNYKTCVQCLQSTTDQTYLSNFLVALKAGCATRPGLDGLLTITGDIFSSSLANYSIPHNQTLPGAGGAGASTITSGTIVGIAVGCGLLFVGAGSLLFVYCRRQKQMKGEKLDSPPPDEPRESGGITNMRKESYFPDHVRSYSNGSFKVPDAGHKRAYSSNAEYYGDREREMMETPVHYHYAPHSRSNGPNGALPTHPAYIPRVVSRMSQRVDSAPARGVQKANVPDSYALQTYLKAAEESAHPVEGLNQAAAQHSRSSSSQSRHVAPPPPRQETAARIPAPPPLPPPPPKIKVPSLAFPSVRKMRFPKQYSPPNVVDQTVAAEAEQGNHGRSVSISRPLAVLDARFQDRYMGASSTLATEVPAGFGESYSVNGKAVTSPLPSGGSARLYG